MFKQETLRRMDEAQHDGHGDMAQLGDIVEEEEVPTDDEGSSEEDLPIGDQYDSEDQYDYFEEYYSASEEYPESDSEIEVFAGMRTFGASSLPADASSSTRTVRYADDELELLGVDDNSTVRVLVPGTQEYADQLGRRINEVEEIQDEVEPPPLEDVVTAGPMTGPAPPAIVQLPAPDPMITVINLRGQLDDSEWTRDQQARIIGRLETHASQLQEEISLLQEVILTTSNDQRIRDIVSHSRARESNRLRVGEPLLAPQQLHGLHREPSQMVPMHEDWTTLFQVTHGELREESTSEEESTDTDTTTERSGDNTEALFVMQARTDQLAAITTSNEREYRPAMRYRERPHSGRPIRKIKCMTVYVEIMGVKALALLDSGCSIDCISPGFATVTRLPTFALDKPIPLQLGCVGSKSVINFGVHVDVSLASNAERNYFDVVNLDHYDVVLGIPFMVKWGIILDFNQNCVRWRDVTIPSTAMVELDERQRPRIIHTDDGRKPVTVAKGKSGTGRRE